MRSRSTGRRARSSLGELDPHPSEIQQVLVERTLEAETLARSTAATRSSCAGRTTTRRLEGAHQRRHARTTPRSARAFGAEGIGLCRTEHMFFAEDRIAAVREMILADDSTAQRRRRSRSSCRCSARTSSGSSRRWTGCRSRSGCSTRRCTSSSRPTPEQFRKLAREMRVPAKQLRGAGAPAPRGEPDARPSRLPPRDHLPRDLRDAGAGDLRGRGARAPPKGIDVLPEIMIPLVGTVREFTELDARIRGGRRRGRGEDRARGAPTSSAR